MEIDETFLPKQKTYIVGVSGGVDSMVLLTMLRLQEYRIVVCHVNYHFRADSDEDQALVEAYCKKYAIPCFSKEIDKDTYTKDNFQMQARNIRYDFYHQIAKQYHTNSVVLGHHLDDVLETMYMQVHRNNTKGYLGIQDKSEVQGVLVYRPLLTYTKEQLYEYSKKMGIEFHEDYTNFECDFTRDYVRNKVLSTYTQEQKQELLTKAKKHNQKHQKIEQEMAIYYQEYQEKGKMKYQHLSTKTLEMVVYYMVKQVVYPPLISNSLIEEIVKQLHSSKPNLVISLPVNAVFIKEYDNMYVSKTNSTTGYCLNYDHLVYDKHDYFYLSKQGHINEGLHLEDSDFPIRIRTYQPGDRIVTSSGTKKVARLFIDNKIAKNQRETWPIVESCDGTIILIPHIAKNIEYLYTQPTVFVVKYRN